MAFRRQDIPKTSRKSDTSSARTLFPRYLKDRAMVPSIRLAIDYLEGMVGRRWGDCSPDTLLELFGDAKLARCLLSCMSERYRYRTLEFADVLGEAQAIALLDWGIATPADLRAYLYLSVNRTRDGFAAGDERVALLSETANVLGVRPDQLDLLIHLDAERNQILARTGPIPEPEEIVARYNAMLTLSVLRHASLISFSTLDLPDATIDAVCLRHEVSARCLPDGTVNLHGRKSTMGSWSPFGARLARCAAHLTIASRKEPAGFATIHLGEQRYEFRLDHKSLAPLRPKQRSAATEHEIAACASLVDQLANYRRETDELAGWTIRRWPEPLVSATGILMPEFAFDRGDVAIPAIPVAPEARTDGVFAEYAAARPAIGLSLVPSHGELPVAEFEPERVVSLLTRLAAGVPANRSPLGIIDHELDAQGWLPEERVAHLLQRPDDLATAVVPLSASGTRVYIAGFGLCETALLDELQALLASGPVDIASYRRAVTDRIGEVHGTDTLILHLLSRSGAISTPTRVAARLDAA